MEKSHFYWTNSWGAGHHLFRYVDEQAFRFNNRAKKNNPINDADGFTLAMSQIVGKRLTYQELTGKTEAAGSLPF
jgi:hypothetical protein